MPATSPGVKPTSWPCGTAPASTRPTVVRHRARKPAQCVSVGRRPRRARRSRPDRHLCGVPRYGAGEPGALAWAEELIEPAASWQSSAAWILYVVAALCWMAGRIDDAIAYSDRRQRWCAPAAERCRSDLMGLLGGTYMVIGELEKALEWEDRYLDRRSDPLAISRSNRVLAVGDGRSSDEAMAAAPDGAQRR